MDENKKFSSLEAEDIDAQPLPPTRQRKPAPTSATIYAAPIEGLSEDMTQAASSQATNLGEIKGASANILRLVLRVAAFNRRKLLLKIIDGEEFTWTKKREFKSWNEDREQWVSHITEETVTETPTLAMRMAAWDLLMKHGLGGNGALQPGSGNTQLPTVIKEVVSR